MERMEVAEGATRGAGRTTGWPDPATWLWPPRWVEVEEGRLHFVRAGPENEAPGGAPRVVLVHGTPTWSYEWRHLLQRLAPTHEVMALDHLGFGRSDRPDRAAYTPEAHARRFAQAMGTLAPEGPVSLVVHDFGGPIALDWALEHPERLAHLVVVNSWMWPLTDDPAMARMARLAGGGLFRLAYRHLNASLRFIMPAAYGNRRHLTRDIHTQYLAPFRDPVARERVLFALARSLAGSSDFYATLWARRERVAGVPATLLWGMEDSALKPSLLERWGEALPHAAVHRLDGVGHWPHEEAPEAFGDRVAEALQGG